MPKSTEKQPDGVEQCAVADFVKEFRRARSLCEKGLQQTNADSASASGTIEYGWTHDKGTGDYDFWLKGKAVKLPGEKYSHKVRMNHGRFEMIQGELPLEETSGLH